MQLLVKPITGVPPAQAVIAGNSLICGPRFSRYRDLSDLKDHISVFKPFQYTFCIAFCVFYLHLISRSRIYTASNSIYWQDWIMLNRWPPAMKNDHHISSVSIGNKMLHFLILMHIQVARADLSLTVAMSVQFHATSPGSE